MLVSGFLAVSLTLQWVRPSHLLRCHLLLGYNVESARISRVLW